MVPNGVIMKKIFKLILIMTFFCSSGYAYYIVIDNIYVKGKIAPVYFPHRLHYDKAIKGLEFPCIRCHHELKDTANKYPGTCVACHLTEEKVNKTNNNKLPVADKNLYHNLCRNCHSEFKKKYPKIPIQCKYCHFNELREISDKINSPSKK